MENIKRIIDTYDLVEMQELIGCYLDQLESYREPDEFMEECRELQVKRCDLILKKLEEVFDNEVK